MTVDPGVPGVVLPVFLLIAGAVIARWWPARRDVADAGLADAQAWALLIDNLREEVRVVRDELRTERSERAAEQQQHRREIAVLRTEVGRLKRELDRRG